MSTAAEAPEVEAPTDGPRRPLRELRGFAKLTAEPGQSATALVWLPWREAADACFSASNAEAILHLPRWRGPA